MSPSPESSATVLHEPEKARFVLLVDGAEAGVAEYRSDGTRRDVYHTEILPEFQGQGLSTPLIEAVLEDTAAQGLRLIPSCSAVAHALTKEKFARFRELLERA
ncbi:N-acetyltransferase [Corynebacterium uropygiale]|uniref:N-acetyltransferase n=1 Tax=Corynebacterium uropygiale TaxID=1775911 RepID=A0A9X1U7T2_9CORY|nr:N-acetyltransferase [Corynebacterium uropygiale]